MKGARAVVTVERGSSVRSWLGPGVASALFVLAFLGAFRGARAFGRTPAETPKMAGLGATRRSVRVAPRADPGAQSSPVARTAAEQAELESLGRKAFFDPGLSEPRGTSCASCHDPARGYAGDNGSGIGVARGSRAGHFARRNTPSLMYLRFVRPFHFHWEEDAPLPDAAGGFFWDGRSDSIAALIVQPLTNPDEMGNRDAAQIADKMRASSYAAAFGAELDQPDSAVLALGRAFEAYLTSDALTPFSSKYDDFVRGRTQLNATETLGLSLFKNPEKGNCASCHRLNDKIPQPARSLFTDYGYEAVGVPRNRRLETDARGNDLGLCERSAPTQAADARFCGSFRTPSLRNVALRNSFMHNGAFAKLRDVVAFYATRGTSPERWYPSGVSFDDLPARYKANVNLKTIPYDRREHEAPRLNDAEIDAVVAFLDSLTDAHLPRASDE